LNHYDEEIAQSEEQRRSDQEGQRGPSAMAKEETDKALNAVLYEVSCQMKNGFARSDN
jgi:dipeptidase